MKNKIIIYYIMSLNRFFETSEGKQLNLEIGASVVSCDHMECKGMVMPPNSDANIHDLTVNGDILAFNDVFIGGNNYNTPDLGQNNYSLHTDGAGNCVWLPDAIGPSGIAYAGIPPTVNNQLLKFNSIDGTTAKQSIITEDGTNLNLNSLNITKLNNLNVKSTGKIKLLNVIEDNQIEIFRNGDTLEVNLIDPIGPTILPFLTINPIGNSFFNTSNLQLGGNLVLGFGNADFQNNNLLNVNEGTIDKLKYPLNATDGITIKNIVGGGENYVLFESYVGPVLDGIFAVANNLVVSSKDFICAQQTTTKNLRIGTLLATQYTFPQNVGANGQILKLNGSALEFKNEQDITVKLNKAGDTMSGTLNMGNNQISNINNAVINNSILIGNTVPATNYTLPSTRGTIRQVLTAQGTGFPTWSALPTRSGAVISFVSNLVNTPIITAGIYEYISGVYALLTPSADFTLNTNLLTYTGETTKNFLIIVTVSWIMGESTPAVTGGLGICKNGTVIAQAKTLNILDDNSTYPRSCSVQYIVSLATNETVSAKVANLDSTADILCINTQISATEL